ncbi:MAG: hypothetical protein HXS46_19240 [Theionarchaea archaeon]|nr:MAG: hypothetical protein AYK18_04370 [Theionarchaea archaeon DG-70]MBU7012824.1 hypothetical protein [Theionarchaea archaeon]
MSKILNEILSHKDKPLDEVAKLVKMEPRDILDIVVGRERALPTPTPAKVEPEKVKKATAPEDDRSDDQLAGYFLNRLQKESLSITALNNKYKVKDKERVERILENLFREGKLTKRESRNKRGRFVYENPKK